MHYILLPKFAPPPHIITKRPFKKRKHKHFTAAERTRLTTDDEHLFWTSWAFPFFCSQTTKRIKSRKIAGRFNRACRLLGCLYCRRWIWSGSNIHPCSPAFANDKALRILRTHRRGVCVREPNRIYRSSISVNKFDSSFCAILVSFSTSSSPRQPNACLPISLPFVCVCVYI